MVTVAFSLSSNCTSGRPTRLERPMTMAFMPSSEACTLLVRMMQPSGVQGDSAASPPARRPALFGCSPSTSLAGSMAVMIVSVSSDFGSGSCTRMPCTAGSRVEFGDQRQQIGLRDIGRQHVLERRHAGGLGLLVLAADIDFAGGIVADQHHGETRRKPMIALHPRHLIGDPRAQIGGNDFSINDAGRHLILRLVIRVEPRSTHAGHRRA